jgi:hypothetical protein
METQQEAVMSWTGQSKVAGLGDINVLIMKPINDQIEVWLQEQGKAFEDYHFTSDLEWLTPIEAHVTVKAFEKELEN